MKKETPEEVAERILANNIDGLKDALKDDDLFFFYKGVICCYGVAMAESEQIKQDEFAIQFAEWCCAKNMGVSKFTLYKGELEQFKKSKGL